VADLANYTHDVDLGARVVPDVARLNRTAPRLLVADAKATERPDDSATRARLSRYADHCRTWCTAGFGVTLAICHDPDIHCSWLRCLQAVASTSGLQVTTCRTAQLEAATWLSSLRVSGVLPGPAPRRVQHRTAPRG
jgi:hypothetical protein